jgi:WD40 repeat protein
MQLSELDWAYVQERAAYFTGRGWVFARLDQFLHGPPGVFLLLGEPGTGKTAVAAQFVLAAAGRLTPAAAEAAPRRGVPGGAAYFCRSGRVDLLDAAQRLSDQLAEAVPGFAHARQATLVPEIHVGDVQVRTGDIAAGGSATGVRIDLSRLGGEVAFERGVTLPLRRAREAGESTQLVLLVDALDESLASQTAKELPRLLGDVEDAHLVVTARPDRRATGWLWERAARVDLLADAPPGSDDVLEYLERRLTPQGAPDAMAVLSRRIAEQASGNFLYAFYVAEALHGAQVLAVLDDAAARRVPLPEGGLPGVYRDFLRRELWRDDRAWSTRFGPVLAPLAVAQDEGLSTEQLRLVAGRPGEQPLTRTAIREVTRTARQFLDGPAPDGPFRVYHQSFADFLVDPEQNPDFLIDAAESHEAIVAAYAATDPLSWDDYARRNLALHASEVGQLDHLLEDARFLLAADPARLVPHLDAARSAPARAAAAVYRQSAHLLARLDWPTRASQLELTAHRLGCRGLAVRIASAAPDRPWQTRWSHGRAATSHQVLTGHTHGVEAVAIGALPDGTPVIVSGSLDHTVRVWRLADGTPLGEPLRGHDGPVSAVAVGALPDGTPVIVSSGGQDDGTVRVWRLADGAPVGGPLRGHDRSVSAVAVGALPDGTPVIVSGSDRDRTVRVWRLADGTPVGEPLRGHDGPVLAVAVGGLPDGTPVIVSGGGINDETVRVWRLADGASVCGPLHGHDGWVGTVAVGALPDGTPVIVSGGEDGMVRVWRLADGAQVGEPLHGHDRHVRAVAVGALPDGTPVIVSGGEDGMVRVWRLADGAQVGEPLHGHFFWVEAVAVGALPDGTAVIVGGGSYEATVAVWRLADGEAVGKPLRGHDDWVEAVAVGALPDGTPVIVSGSHDETIRVWQLADGTPVGEPLRGHGGWVNAVAVGALPDGTPVIVSGGNYHSMVRVWRLADGAPVGEPLRGHDGPIHAVLVAALLDGTPVIVSGAGDGTVRVWRLADGAPVGEPLHGHDGPVLSVAVGRLLDGTPVIVSGGGDDDQTVRVWRLADGAPVGEPLRGHTGWVSAVAVAALPDGTPVIVSGSDRDRTVRVWRLADGAPVGEPLRGHTGSVEAVGAGALPDGTPVIVTGGEDATVRVWRLADGTPLVPSLDLPESVRAVAVHGNVIVAAAGADLAVHQPTLLRSMH